MEKGTWFNCYSEMSTDKVVGWQFIIFLLESSLSSDFAAVRQIVLPNQPRPLQCSIQQILKSLIREHATEL